MEREAQTKDEKGSLKEGLEREEKLVERGRDGNCRDLQRKQLSRRFYN